VPICRSDGLVPVGCEAYRLRLSRIPLVALYHSCTGAARQRCATVGRGRAGPRHAIQSSAVLQGAHQAPHGAVVPAARLRTGGPLGHSQPGAMRRRCRAKQRSRVLRASLAPPISRSGAPCRVPTAQLWVGRASLFQWLLTIQHWAIVLLVITGDIFSMNIYVAEVRRSTGPSAVAPERQLAAPGAQIFVTLGFFCVHKIMVATKVRTAHPRTLCVLVWLAPQRAARLPAPARSTALSRQPSLRPSTRGPLVRGAHVITSLRHHRAPRRRHIHVRPRLGLAGAHCAGHEQR
jgi:hypothetical protein